jgi:RNA polymerase sigma factor (TIGR02999 family)
MSEITRILSKIESGELGATEKLLPLVYEELRKLAAVKLAKEASGPTLQPTMLVHEAYLRLVDVDQPQKWNGRGHFFSAAAEAMRRILVENARRKQSQKRGGKMQRIDLDVAMIPIVDSEVALLALDEALIRLEEQWPEKANIVKLKYFAGLTISELSKALGISTATAERHWKFARAWLHSQLKEGE